MRAILVDDEPLILEYLEKLLLEWDEIEVVGKYYDPYQALQVTLNEKPDVVFLDIEMPEVMGVDLAEKIQTNIPDTKIVFVTAYSEYAVEAFELNAVDYLVKPIQYERLHKTLQRIKHLKGAHPAVASEQLAGEPLICCFKSLQFKRTGTGSPIPEVQWRTHKAKELFALLVHHREKPVRKDLILDTFWPDADLKKGMALLYSTIYHIRKTLKAIHFNISITSQDNSYTLHLNGTKLDVEEWEKELYELPDLSAGTLPAYQELLQSYTGDYLDKFDYVWAEAERERLRSQWLHLAGKVADFLIEKGEYTQSIAIYNRIQEQYPYMDESYYKLMQLYAKIGDHHTADQQYRKVKEMLSQHQ